MDNPQRKGGYCQGFRLIGEMLEGHVWLLFETIRNLDHLRASQGFWTGNTLAGDKIFQQMLTH